MTLRDRALEAHRSTDEQRAEREAAALARLRERADAAWARVIGEAAAPPTWEHTAEGTVAATVADITFEYRGGSEPDSALMLGLWVTRVGERRIPLGVGMGHITSLAELGEVIRRAEAEPPGKPEALVTT